MTTDIILASKSKIRASLLKNAGVSYMVVDAGIDEEQVKLSYINEGYSPRDVADVLADMKAKKLSNRFPGKLVIGCDQILSFKDQIISKARNSNDLVHQLQTLEGNEHIVYSASVVYIDNKPEWRFIGSAKMTMRNLSHKFISKYVEENWTKIQHSVGGYEIESSGVSLFSKVDGDYFSVLGIPLLQLIDYLINRGVIKQ
jgi:septum formation protein